MCTYFDENFLNLVPAEHVEGLYGCLDYYRDVKDPFSTELAVTYAGQKFPDLASGNICAYASGALMDVSGTSNRTPRTPGQFRR